jgi:hypothetical protein
MTLTFLFVYFGLAIRLVVETIARLLLCVDMKNTPQISVRVFKLLSLVVATIFAVDLTSKI